MRQLMQHHSAGHIPNMAKRKTRTSPLFKLPPELRNTIYDLVLDDARQTVVIPFRPPSLLNVCKQVKSEASPIFFSQNEFYASLTTADVKAFSRSLKDFGSEGAKAVSSLTISLDLDAEIELYRTSKFGGGGVMNYPHWLWVDVPRLIMKAGVPSTAIRITTPLAVAWTQDAMTYADRWIADMREGLPGAVIQSNIEYDGW